jgi:hypothetical protein
MVLQNSPLVADHQIGAERALTFLPHLLQLTERRRWIQFEAYDWFALVAKSRLISMSKTRNEDAQRSNDSLPV